MNIINRLQYRHRIAAVILFFMLIPLIVSGAALYKGIWNERVQNILSEHSNNINTYAAVTDSLMASCSQKSMYIKANPSVISYLSLEQGKDMVSTLTFTDYMQDLARAVNADNSNTVIRVFALRNSFDLGDYYRSEGSFRNELSADETKLEEKILALNFNDVLWTVRELNRDRYSTTTMEEYLCLYRIINTSDFIAGIVEIGIPVKHLQELYPDDIPEGSFAVMSLSVNNGREFITLKNKTGADVNGIVDNYLKTGASEKYKVISSGIPFAKGRVYMFVPNSYIISKLKWDVILLVVVILLIFAILVVTVEVVSYYLTRKLSGLIGQMSKDLDEIINNDEMKIYTSDDEIGRIGNKVFGLIKRASEYESQKRLLELELLQARFNPHFLYNTLGTIKYIIKDRSVQSVIDSMVKYYRIALNKGSNIIHISKELELISEYLKLQKFSYARDFEVIMEIAPEVGGYSIIKHLLQPIVENALLHGISGIENGGIIKIKANVANRDILFEISDNGTGMSQEKLQMLLDKENTDSPGGYGIKNVQKRIAVYYGDEYGITIESQAGSGTNVKMRIPAVMYEDAMRSKAKSI